MKLLFSLFLTLTLVPATSYAMLKAINTAATGMTAQQEMTNAISNNIANVNTTGYKKQRAEFEDLYYETIQEAGGRSSASTQYSVGTQIGSGSKLSAIRKEFTVGNPQITKNPFDLMIAGDGFFGIQLPNGAIQYSRDGGFSTDSQGNIVTKSGYKLFPGFTLPPGTRNVHITPEGTIEAFLTGQVEPTQVGQIPVFTFINPVGLSNAGGNLYRETRSSGQPIQNIAGTSNAGAIQQGVLEASNVVITNEMSDLIKAQRAFELNSKVMQTADQMLQTVNNIR